MPQTDSVESKSTTQVSIPQIGHAVLRQKPASWPYTELRLKVSALAPLVLVFPDKDRENNGHHTDYCGSQHSGPEAVNVEVDVKPVDCNA